MEFLPPAVNKKDIPHFPFRQCSVTCPCWGSLPHWHCVSTLHSSNPGFIKVWQPCQYSPPKEGKKPSSALMRWTNVLINLNIVGAVTIVCKTMFSNVGIMHKICTCHLCIWHVIYHQITHPCVALSSVHVIVRWQDKRFVYLMMDERLTR